MNKKWIKGILVFAFIVLVTSLILNYVMYGGARDIQSEKSEFKVDSQTILTEYSSDAELANKKYLNKTIEVSGIVTQVNEKAIIVDHSIICNIKSDSEKPKKETSTRMKGRVVGFDDLLEELKLDDCSIVKN